MRLAVLVSSDKSTACLVMRGTWEDGFSETLLLTKANDTIIANNVTETVRNNFGKLINSLLSSTREK